jgi:hypothetical protein
MTDPALPATGSVSVEVNSTLEALWPLMCDPSTPAKFSNELREAKFVGTTVPAKGAVIEGHNGRGDFEWSTESIVVDCEAPTLFRWATGDFEQPTATWTLEASEAAGTVTLVHSVIFHADRDPLGSAIAKEPERAHAIVDGRMADVLVNMRATIDGMADQASKASRTS